MREGNTPEYRRSSIAKHVKSIAAKHTHLQFCTRTEYVRNPALKSSQVAYYLALDAQHRYDSASRNANMAASLALVNASRGLTDAHECSAAAATTAATCGRAQKCMLDRLIQSMFLDQSICTADADAMRMSHWDNVLFHEQGRRPETFGPAPGTQEEEEHAATQEKDVRGSIENAFGKLEQAQARAIEEIKLLQQANKAQVETDAERASQDKERATADSLRAMYDQERVHQDEVRKRDDHARHETDYRRYNKDGFRESADEARALQDKDRANYDSARAAADQTRQGWSQVRDDARRTADEERAAADEARAQADVIRREDDEDRSLADLSRTSQDTVRTSQDAARENHDMVRVDRDNVRADQDMTRVDRDIERVNRDTERANQDTERANRDNVRAETDTRRTAQDTTRVEQDVDRESTDAARASQDAWREQLDADAAKTDLKRVQQDQEQQKAYLADLVARRLLVDDLSSAISLIKTYEKAAAAHLNCLEETVEKQAAREKDEVTDPSLCAVDQAFASALDRLTGVCEQLVQQNKEIAEKQEQNARQIDGLKHARLKELAAPVALVCETAVGELNDRGETCLADEMTAVTKRLHNL